MKMEMLRIASDRLHVSSCGSAAPHHRHNVGNIKLGIISPEYNFKILLTFIKTLIKKNDLENSQ